MREHAENVRLTRVVTIAERRASIEQAVRSELVRHRLGLGPREDVAPRLGVSVCQLGKWERGEARVPAWVLLAVRELARVAA